MKIETYKDRRYNKLEYWLSFLVISLPPPRTFERVTPLLISAKTQSKTNDTNMIASKLVITKGMISIIE